MDRVVADFSGSFFFRFLLKKKKNSYLDLQAIHFRCERAVQFLYRLRSKLPSRDYLFNALVTKPTMYFIRLYSVHIPYVRISLSQLLFIYIVLLRSLKNIRRRYTFYTTCKTGLRRERIII